MAIPIAVAGAGPIGAATAFHLARAGLQVTVVSQDRSDAAFRNSGGSICWHRPDPRRARLIRETADFIRHAIADGAAIRCRDVPYLFLTDGVQVPALNIDSADLVDHLLAQACHAGAATIDIGRIDRVEPGDRGHLVRGEHGSVTARVVVLALGATNADLAPTLDGTWEKRQLFVLDLPVDAARASLPHTIAAVGEGFAYVFVKELTEDLRVVVGQEDLIVDEDLSGPVDHFDALLDTGVARHFPFLRGATVEQVLWGIDWEGKLPHVQEHAPGLLTINCGSAVRACIGAGRAAAEAARLALSAA